MKDKFKMVRETVKPFSVLILGTLAITAFIRGEALDITLGIFWGLFVIYSAVKYVRKKRNPKGKTYIVILEPKRDAILKKAGKSKIKKILLNIVLVILYGLFFIYSGIKYMLQKRKAKSKTSTAISKYSKNIILNQVRTMGFGRLIQNAVSKIIR